MTGSSSGSGKPSSAVVPRLHLHARSLEFRHPMRAESVQAATDAAAAATAAAAADATAAAPDRSAGNDRLVRVVAPLPPHFARSLSALGVDAKTLDGAVAAAIPAAVAARAASDRRDQRSLKSAAGDSVRTSSRRDVDKQMRLSYAAFVARQAARKR